MLMCVLLMAPTTPGRPYNCWKPTAPCETSSHQSYWISFHKPTLIACTTSRSIIDIVLCPTANISLQINKLAPWLNLKSTHAKRIGTGTNRRYLVSLCMLGASMGTNLKTDRFVNLNISIQRRSSYSCNKNREKPSGRARFHPVT